MILSSVTWRNYNWVYTVYNLPRQSGDYQLVDASYVLSQEKLLLLVNSDNGEHHSALTNLGPT